MRYGVRRGRFLTHFILCNTTQRFILSLEETHHSLRDQVLLLGSPTSTADHMIAMASTVKFTNCLRVRSGVHLDLGLVDFGGEPQRHHSSYCIESAPGGVDGDVSD